MLKTESLKKYIDEVIAEIENELDEATATGDIAGYETPNAFSDGSDATKRRKKKIATQLGMQLVGKVESVNESLITEKQFKGLEGISATTPLTKITKDQKLKIIKGVGNIIDFIVPKGVSRNFWQVIGTGKIKKNLSGEYYLEGKVINSPMFKSMGDLINGIKWDSMEERRRFNESINENRWLELKNDDSMHANKKLAVGLKELKNQLSEVEKFFRWYNQIKTMNELDSNQYWKRTNSHIYKIKERIINIARTLQEIEK